MSSSSTEPVHVVVRFEDRHEQVEPHVAEIRPDGMPALLRPETPATADA